MKQVLILERCTSGLNRVNESASRNLRDYVMGGTFTEFDKLNRNNRIYTAEKFIPHLNELAGRINDFGVVYGEYDHPEGFEIQLKNASHIINSVKYISEEKRVHGEIKLLTTKFGKEARALVDDGCPVFVSSRAAGVTESNGHVQVRRLFTYDIVADPGFSSAKMDMKNMNESFGLPVEDNLRIYDMTNESTTNELFNMNGNDNVTRTMMREYGDHLMAHVAKLEAQLVQYVKEGRDASEIEKTAELVDNTHANLTKVNEYLDYLSSELVAQVSKNEDLNKVVETLTTQNNAMVEKLDRAVAYMELVSEKVDTTISFVEHVAGNVKSSIEFTEHVAENVKSSIEFSEYIAEHVKTDKDYMKMIAEGLTSNVDNLSETVKGNVAFTEYLAGHVKNSVEYVEYVVEAVEENGDYALYLAKNLDGLIDHSHALTETLNARFAEGGVNEAVISIESPVTSLGLDNQEETSTEETAEETDENGEPVAAATDEVTVADIDAAQPEPEITGIAGDEGTSSDSVNTVEDGEAAAAEPVQGEVATDEPAAQIEPAQGEATDDLSLEADTPELDAEVSPEATATAETPVNAVETEEVPTQATTSAATRIELDGDEIHITKNGQETVIKLGGGDTAVAESLTDKLSTLIAEAKKRKASDTNEPHFFKFLTESQVVDFKALAEEQQEQVKVAMNESEYFSGHDVLKVIHKTLAANEPTLNEKLVANIPADVQENWTSMNESQQSVVLATSRFYVGDLNNPRQMENFWRTRSLAVSVNENKTVLNETLKGDDSFGEDEINRFINRFKNI